MQFEESLNAKALHCLYLTNLNYRTAFRSLPSVTFKSRMTVLYLLETNLLLHITEIKCTDFLNFHQNVLKYLAYSPEPSIFVVSFSQKKKKKLLGNICLLLCNIQKYQGIKRHVRKCLRVFLFQLPSPKATTEWFTAFHRENYQWTQKAKRDTEGYSVGSSSYSHALLQLIPLHSGSFERSCLDGAWSAWNSTSQAWTWINRVSGQARAVMKSRWVEFSSFEKKEEEETWNSHIWTYFGMFPEEENEKKKKKRIG